MDGGIPPSDLVVRKGARKRQQKLSVSGKQAALSTLRPLLLIGQKLVPP